MAEGESLGEMFGLNDGGVGKVGDGAGDFDGLEIGTGGEVEFFGSGF